MLNYQRVWKPFQHRKAPSMSCLHPNFPANSSAVQPLASLQCHGFPWPAGPGWARLHWCWLTCWESPIWLMFRRGLAFKSPKDCFLPHWCFWKSVDSSTRVAGVRFAEFSWSLRMLRFAFDWLFYSWLSVGWFQISFNRILVCHPHNMRNYNYMFEATIQMPSKK